MSAVTVVDCGVCHACCRDQVVMLLDGEDPADFDCAPRETPHGTIHILNHKPNGDCVYLGAAGCTIHGRHPALCRTFDCAGFARMWPRARRRARGMPMNDVLREGLRRLHEIR